MSQQQQQIGSDGKPVPGVGPETQNQSFLRKYWYIILPVMIMSLTGGAPPEEGERATTQAAATAGSAAAATAGAAARPRRGKRS